MNSYLNARPVSTLRHAISRSFIGGLVTEHSNLALAQEHLTVADNVYIDALGTPYVRHGVILFSTTQGVAEDNIVGSHYFSGSIINVHSSGEITATNASGISTVIWNATIAAALPGSPLPWGPTTEVNFAQQAGKLVIVNGVDKPLVCNEALQVRYLADPATDSNVNVPRAKLAISHKNFLILAHTPTDKHTLYIGAKGTLYTAPGDPPPNNAVLFDISSYVSRGDPDIVALAQFKNRLVVFCYETVVVMLLDIFEGGAHKPTVVDVIENAGALAQRAVVYVRDSLFVLDRNGVMRYKRAVLNDDLVSEMSSGAIRSDIVKAISGFSLVELSRRCFCVVDRINQHILWFTPGTDSPFVLHYNMPGQAVLWTRFRNMPYTDAFNTVEGRVFFSRSSELFFYGNDPSNPLHYDALTSLEQPWDDNTPWDDGTGWIEPSLSSPIPISFRIVTPWSELRAPGQTKQSKYFNLLTQCDGAGPTPITVRMETDRLGPALTINLNHTPTPTMENNPTNNEQWYAWPAKFVRMRFDISGSTVVRFKLVAIQLWYQLGAWGR